MTIWDSYSILRLPEYTNQLKKTTIFSTLDARPVYSKNELGQSGEVKTGFVTENWLYSYTRVLFSQRNA